LKRKSKDSRSRLFTETAPSLLILQPFFRPFPSIAGRSCGGAGDRLNVHSLRQRRMVGQNGLAELGDCRRVPCPILALPTIDQTFVCCHCLQTLLSSGALNGKQPLNQFGEVFHWIPQNKSWTSSQRRQRFAAPRFGFVRFTVCSLTSQSGKSCICALGKANLRKFHVSRLRKCGSPRSLLRTCTVQAALGMTMV
jgi:hypothetical protein